MKRLSALLLAILFTFTYTSLVPVSADDLEAPKNTVITRLPLEGDGTEASPYLIGTREELVLLARAVNGGGSVRGLWFALSADVDLSGDEWEPIGKDAAYPFDGSFAGNGFVISGLTINNGGDHSALFGVSIGSVEGVTVENAFVSGTDYVSAVVAEGSCENCRAGGVISGTSFVGGVVGEGSVFLCGSACSVTGEEYVGGVIGMGDAVSSVNSGEVSGSRFTGGVTGCGVERGSFARDEERVPNETELKTDKYSVTAFVKWALTHIEYTSIPSGATLAAPRSSCGTDTWQYLYGSVRAKVNTTTINNYFSNHYNKYMFRSQYDDLTSGWTGSYNYATDCQGLLDAWMTYEAGVSTDLNADMNYSYWCTQKGEISSITRQYVVGEAVFRYSKWLGRMGHVGWICGFDDDGEPLVVEAKGVSFGVIVTRLSDGSWTHRGLMTAKFYYDSTLTPSSQATHPAAEPDPAETFRNEESAPTRAVWNGTVASGFAGGSGTQADPYRVSTAEQLAYVAYAVKNDVTFNGEYIELTNDIWLNDTLGWMTWDHFDNPPKNSWSPIGYYADSKDYKPFKGSFDGKGHTVYGMFIHENSVSCLGLFGYVAGNQSGYIKNVTVARSVIKGGCNSGGIVGCLSDYGRVDSCYFTGIINAESWTGGVVGYAWNTSGTTYIYNCANLGTVKGTTCTGGIVGMAKANCVISECSNTGSLVKCFKMAGGIVGRAVSSTVSICRNHCLTTGADMIGGIAGVTVSSSVYECYNGCDLSAGKRLGGLTGYTSGGSVKNCFSSGNAVGREKTGGLVANAKNLTLECCYNVGKVVSAHTAGAAVGYAEGTVTATHVYVLEGCCPAASNYGTAMSADKFNKQLCYTGFDFTNIWVIDPGTEYPAAELKRVRYTADKIPDIPAPEPDPTPEPTLAPTPTPTAAPTTAPTTAPTSSPGTGLMGDADDNGCVEPADALLVLRYSMGIVDGSEIPGLDRCDITGDGEIGADDALIILRMSMGIIE